MRITATTGPVKNDIVPEEDVISKEVVSLVGRYWMLP
jgi:hypothetical protein